MAKAGKATPITAEEMVPTTISTMSNVVANLKREQKPAGYTTYSLFFSSLGGS
jgi:hypothetical protein